MSNPNWIQFIFVFSVTFIIIYRIYYIWLILYIHYIKLNNLKCSSYLILNLRPNIVLWPTQSVSCHYKKIALSTENNELTRSHFMGFSCNFSEIFPRNSKPTLFHLQLLLIYYFSFLSYSKRVVFRRKWIWNLYSTNFLICKNTQPKSIPHSKSFFFLEFWFQNKRTSFLTAHVLCSNI